MHRLRFLSANVFKIREAEQILEPFGIQVVAVNERIAELQNSNIEQIVRDKSIRAFHRIGRPLFVEQTGLFFDALNGFPGGLTQVFWDTIQADRICNLFGKRDLCTVTAKTYIGYCDGRSVEIFTGEVAGKIAPEPRGNREFQWDCVFIPNEYEQTFSELGEHKNEISMRRQALSRLAHYLQGV